LRLVGVVVVVDSKNNDDDSIRKCFFHEDIGRVREGETNT
jgi:hypothetical protein